MATQPSRTDSQGPFFVLLGLLLVTAFLYWAQKILIPIALAILLAFILTPPVSALQRRGLGRVPSTLTVVVLTFALLGVIGWMIWLQIGNLVDNLPRYQKEISHKLESLRGAGDSKFWTNIRAAFDEVAHQITQPPTAPQADVKPGSTPERPLYTQTAASRWAWLSETAGPAAEALASAFLILVMVIFMLIQRENLRNRMVRLIGHGRLIGTTRAIDESARRVSRYLLMQLCINAIFGLVLASGLFVFGLSAGQPDLRRYALMWGFFACILRFVPYLGTWVAAALLFLFSVGTLPGWGLPVGVFILFLTLELVTANAVEPLLFGHSTGSSPLALLLAAAFWTWLWGPLGLVLSTPLTVLLVVVGKYVPPLHFFEVLLGDEPALSTDVTFYQRLVARDHDEASDLVDEYLQSHSVEAAYEEVLLPALVRAQRDRDRGALDADDLDLVRHALGDFIDELGSLQEERAAKPDTDGKPPAAKVRFLGCPARDVGDELALRMLKDILEPQGYTVEIISSGILTAEVLERIGSECPKLICIGSLPPGGLAQARYLCKRVRMQCPQVKIAVGRWGEKENLERIEKRLKAAGADFVATTLLDTRTQIIPLLQVAAVATQAEPAPEPAQV